MKIIWEQQNGVKIKWGVYLFFVLTFRISIFDKKSFGGKTCLSLAFFQFTVPRFACD